MIARLLVLTYFPFFFLSVGLAELAGHSLLLGFHLAPAGFYVASRLACIAVRGGSQTEGVGILTAALFVFVGLYSILFFPRAYSGPLAVATAPTLVVHVLFWHFVYNARTYSQDRHTFFKDLWWGVAAGFGVGAAGAVAHVGSFQPGAVHNLAEEAAFVRSDLDVPLLGVAVGTIGAVFLFRAEDVREAARWSRRGGAPSRWTGALLLAAAFGGLFVYSRRTPLFALLAICGLFILPKAPAKRLFSVALLFPFVPVVWDYVAIILVTVTQNPVFDALLARNDVETYLTATNRILAWQRSFEFLANVRFQHFLGFGNVPASILPLDWTHVHNAFLQLIFEAGVIVFALGVYLIVATYRRLMNLVGSARVGGHALVLYGLFIAWLIHSGVEPGFRGYSMINLLFLMTVVLVGNVYEEERRRRRVEV